MFISSKTSAAALTAMALATVGCSNENYRGQSVASANTEATVMVGGAAMYPSRNIIENAVNSNDHTTLVAAVKAAGLVETLSGPGPFTVFAPTNDAFAKLPAGTVDTLLKPENKTALAGVLTYHVVPGRVTAGELVKMIGNGGGMAKLTTVNGATLTAKMMNGNVVLVDAKGGTATVTQADVMQSNGVIHVTNAVSIPG
ncbi:fasciclin domain-containing protein [Pontixanthobacter sp.]|uniref:fasciclin domain-containing protein n=1 Tax=Pontixanthobacter sp. TaxID=2792078 RepID=UPI003C7C39C8